MTVRPAGAARGAFTLIELLVVLVVLGLMLSVVGPAFTRGASTRESEGAAVVSRLLDAARRTALTSASRVEVTLDPATLRVWVRGAHTEPPLDTTFVLGLPDGVRLAASRARVQFNFERDGAADSDTVVVRGDSHSILIWASESAGTVTRDVADAAAGR